MILSSHKKPHSAIVLGAVASLSLYCTVMSMLTGKFRESKTESEFLLMIPPAVPLLVAIPALISSLLV